MPADRKTHDALAANWKENAERRVDRTYRFLRSLKQRSSDRVDRLAKQLHHEAFSILDCTKCAECCRKLRAVFSEEDIARVADHLGMARDEFIAVHLETDEEQGRYRIKATPCSFLGNDSRCTIYDMRPAKCREYPFTDKPDFACRTMNHANNALVCPGVFHLVEEMRKRLGR